MDAVLVATAADEAAVHDSWSSGTGEEDGWRALVVRLTIPTNGSRVETRLELFVVRYLGWTDEKRKMRWSMEQRKRSL